MQSLNDDRVKDNAVILFALLLARFQVSRSTMYPSRIKASLLRRIGGLIKEYRNPSKGIRYDDPGESHEEANQAENH